MKRLAAILLAATLLIAGGTGQIAAAPGDAPDDAGAQADEDHDATDEDQDAEDAGNGSASVGAAEDASASDGDMKGNHAREPSDALPEQVPDHVAEIHSLIDRFLNGDLTDLGGAISGEMAADAPADDDADSGDINAAESSDGAGATATETPA